MKSLINDFIVDAVVIFGVSVFVYDHTRSALFTAAAPLVVMAYGFYRHYIGFRIGEGKS